MGTTGESPVPKVRQPYFWLGYDLVSWVRLLCRNRFAIDLSRLHIVLIVSVISVLNSALGLLERIIHGRRIARARIHPAPIFILGHWRSGTTLLHELLACDPRLGYPNTYECFAPHHFLLTNAWLPRWLTWLLPQKRPMDNMKVGLRRPQEDEFALCLLGQPSHLAHVAFPNRIGLNDPSLHVERLPASARRRWQATFMRFLRRLTLAHAGKQLVLKSPPHACRIPLLLEILPEARFVHIVRDPYAIYPSTLKLWRTLFAHHSLQRPNWRGLQPHILDTFVTMFERLEHDRKQILPGRLYEIRFEDLLADPMSQLEAIYKALGLGDFEPARGPVVAYLTSVRDYTGNQLMITREEKEAISSRWGQVIDRYGYKRRES